MEKCLVGIPGARRGGATLRWAWPTPARGQGRLTRSDFLEPCGRSRNRFLSQPELQEGLLLGTLEVDYSNQSALAWFKQPCVTCALFSKKFTTLPAVAADIWRLPFILGKVRIGGGLCNESGVGRSRVHTHTRKVKPQHFLGRGRHSGATLQQSHTTGLTAEAQGGGGEGRQDWVKL